MSKNFVITGYPNIKQWTVQIRDIKTFHWVTLKNRFYGNKWKNNLNILVTIFRR